MHRLDAFGFESDFIELRRNDVAIAVAPENLHRVGSERNIARVASLQRALEHDDGVREVLVALALDDVVLRVILEDVFEV